MQGSFYNEETVENSVADNDYDHSILSQRSMSDLNSQQPQHYG